MTYCPENGRDPNPRPMQRGRPGYNAFETWQQQQPPGADTSWCAYMAAITGLSAYEDWASRQEEGEDTSWSAYMNAIRGDSAYQIWASYQPTGSDISMTAYLASMEGKPGTPGKDGEPGAPGTPGKDGEPGTQLLFVDLKVNHVFGQDDHDLTFRANNAGMLLRMKGVLSGSNIKIVSFVPQGVYVYKDASNNQTDVMTTVGITPNYDLFVSMNPIPTQVLNNNTYSTISVTSATAYPVVRVYYTVG